MIPDWLPAEIDLGGSDVSADYAKLHAIYSQDFDGRSPLFIEGHEVVVSTTVDPHYVEAYTYGFTHLVTCGDDTRSIDYPRAKKLPWVRAVIQNYSNPEVKAFWATNSRGESLFLWLYDYDFVVILKKLDSLMHVNSAQRILVTAYNVYPTKRAYFERLYDTATCIL